MQHHIHLHRLLSQKGRGAGKVAQVTNHLPNPYKALSLTSISIGVKKEK